MSSTASARTYAPRYATPAARPGSHAPRPAPLPRTTIHVIERPEPDAKSRAWPVVLAALLLLVLAIAVPLVINTQMAEMAYEIRDAQVELAEVQAQTSVLEADLLRAASPQELGARAKELGLVPAAAPGTVNLDEATVTGGQPAQQATP